MKTYGLLGYPLGHSFSKKYFEDKFEKEGINAEFTNFELEKADMMLDYTQGGKDFLGFCITIPHKENIIPLLDQCDDAIKEIGAVNCVKIIHDENGVKLKGYNTDVIGFEKSFLEFYKPSHKKAIILGTGGAAKAVEYVMSKLGISYQLVSRRKAENTITYDELTEEYMSDIQVIINTTPLGMYPKIEACPDIPYQYIGVQHYCYDLIYNPLETLFLAKAKTNGAATKAGMDMLELQAEANWDIWNS